MHIHQSDLYLIHNSNLITNVESILVTEEPSDSESDLHERASDSEEPLS